MREPRKFWTQYRFNHSIATQILHHDGAWNLFYDYPFYRETYAESRVARDIEIYEITVKEVEK